MAASTSLMVAASKGDKKTLKSLLAQPGTDVNTQDETGETALVKAIAKGHEGSTILLLAHPDTRVNQTDERGKSPLMLAASKGQEEIIKLLLSSSPQVDINQRDDEGQSALMKAAWNGQEGAIKLLLQDPKIDVNGVDRSGESALAKAIGQGYERIVGLLLAHPTMEADRVDTSGRSPLMLAAAQGREEIAKLLLKAPGTDVNLLDEAGESALAKAVVNGHEGVVVLLLAHPEIQVNTSGSSPLMFAVEKGLEHVVKVLLAHSDTNTQLVDQLGRTPLRLAHSMGHPRIVELLRAHEERNQAIEGEVEDKLGGVESQAVDKLQSPDADSTSNSVVDKPQAIEMDQKLIDFFYGGRAADAQALPDGKIDENAQTFLSDVDVIDTNDGQDEQTVLDSFREGKRPDCFIRRRRHHDVVDDTETNPEGEVEVHDSQTLHLEAGVDVDSNSNAITMFAGVTSLSIGSKGVLNAAGRDINNHFQTVYEQRHQQVVNQYTHYPLPPLEQLLDKRKKQRGCWCPLTPLLLLGAIALLTLLTALVLPSIAFFPSFFAWGIR